MDVFTHAALGATLAAAAPPPQTRLSRRARLGIGALAAAFPDLDFAAFPLDPLRFLADWHQGPTHSLLLLPLWAAALGGGCAPLLKRPPALAEAVLVSALGLASHIAADAITAYGTAVFHPLSAWRIGLGLSFVLDPLFSLIVLAGFVGAARGAPRGLPAACLAALCVYVGAQAILQRQALDAGAAAARTQGIALERLMAVAQPLSPFNWKLIGASGESFYEGYVNVGGHRPWVPEGMPWLGALAAAYRPPGELVLRPRPRFGEAADLRALARERWEDPRFAPFRRFAAAPVVSRIDRDARGTCVWFTDLRYDLPALPDTFRFGFCRSGAAQPWQPYRLRYFREDARQTLPP